MKKIFLPIFFMILTSEFLAGQEPIQKPGPDGKMYFGIEAGPSFSYYFAGSENSAGGLGSPTTYEVAYEKTPRIGFTAGVFFELQIVKHFSLRTALCYYQSTHRIFYVKKVGGGVATDFYGDYNLTGSNIQLSILPKLSIGMQNRVYIIFGPFFDLWTHSYVKGQIDIETHYYPGHPATSRTIRDQEIGTQINSQIGLLLGAGLNIPVKENYFCIEMKFGYGFNNVVNQPNMRQILFGFSLIYQLKI